MIAYWQSGATAPLWSVFSWCSKSVLLAMEALGGAAAAAGRLTPLGCSAAGAAAVAVVDSTALLGEEVAAASPSTTVNTSVPIGD